MKRLITTLALILFSLLVLLPGRTALASSTPSDHYGFTQTAYSLTTNGNQIVTDTLGAGASWFRVQRHWADIELSPGVFDWTIPDQAIQLANAHGIRVDFPIQLAPTFHQGQICYSADKTQSRGFPTPQELATFATIVATRYNGLNGHGRVDAFEIGNEEYDQTWFGSYANSAPCRSAQNYAETLKAGYLAIKAVDPTMKVGMFGLWWKNTQHINDFLGYLVSKGYSHYMDYASLHFYHGCSDPGISGGSNDISLTQELGLFQQKLSGTGLKVVIGEIGFASDGTSGCYQSQQSTLMSKALTIIHQFNTTVLRVMWYTDFAPASHMDLTNGAGLRYPAYTTYRNFISTHPNL